MRKRKKILYLDQFAVSNMYNADPTTPWGLLRDTIIEKVNKGVLLCPMPIDHLYETAGRSMKDNEGILNEEYSKQIEGQHNFFRALAHGTVFYYYEEIVATEIIMLLKHGEVNLMKSFYLHKSYLAQIDICEIYDELHKFNLENHEHTTNLYKFANEIRDISKSHSINSRTHKKEQTETMFLNAIVSLEVGNLIKELKALYQRGFVSIRGVQCGTFEVNNQVDTIIYNLTQKKIDKKSTERLIRELETHRFDRIPSLYIHSILNADMALTNKHQTPNDAIDLDRAAVGLRVSDYFFADNEKKLTIEKYHLDKKYKTKVYSGKKDSILALTKELLML